jgi:ParB-like chromosome segregation protein Spo0J
MPEQLLNIADIRIDGDTQPRLAVDEAVVAEYAEDMKAGAEFPPVRVVSDGAAHWLVDGFHRYYAHRKLGRTQIRAEVTTGLLTEAQWLSFAANKGHGLRRSNADKSKAVIKALRMRPDLSDHAIAEHVGVSSPTVSKYRAPPISTVKSLQSQPRTGRDGRTIRTRGITEAARKRSNPPASSKTFPQIRDFGKPDPKTALNMPHDPVMGARTLIEVFKPDYLRALVAFLQEHLKGVPA